MGTTAAYAWLRTRAAAAGASPARDSLRSSSTGRLPLLARTQRSDVASALRSAENIIQIWEEWTLCYLADVILLTLRVSPTHSTFNRGRCVPSAAARIAKSWSHSSCLHAAAGDVAPYQLWDSNRRLVLTMAHRA